MARSEYEYNKQSAEPDLQRQSSRTQVATNARHGVGSDRLVREDVVARVLDGGVKAAGRVDRHGADSRVRVLGGEVARQAAFVRAGMIKNG